MGTKVGLYRMRKEAYAQQVQNSNRLFYIFFGKKAEPIREVNKRLSTQVQVREINKMAAEFAELNKTTC